MSNDIKDVINELDRIDGLLGKLVDLDDEIESAKAKNDQDLRDIYNKYRPKLPASMPAFKTLEPEVGAFESDNASTTQISLIGFGASLLLYLIAKIADIFSIQGFCFIAVIAFGIWFMISYQKYAADRKKYDETVERRQNFEEIMKSNHAQDRLELQSTLHDYYTNFQVYDHMLEECYADYVAKNNSLVEEYNATQDTLSEVTLLSEEYIYLAGRISGILKSGRADTFKEGLNLAVSEKRDEDYKAQKLAEEAHRTRIAEQQAYDNMLHNQRMEREAEAQTRQAQMQSSIAQAQLKATEKQNAQLEEILKNQKR